MVAHCSRTIEVAGEVEQFCKPKASIPILDPKQVKVLRTP